MGKKQMTESFLVLTLIELLRRLGGEQEINLRELLELNHENFDAKPVKDNEENLILSFKEEKEENN